MMIAGVGAVSAVGLSAPVVGAAIRAGIAQPSALEGLVVLDPDTEEASPVFGHPLRCITDGFQGPGRWHQLVRLAVDDLWTHTSSEVPVSMVVLVTPMLDPERFPFLDDEDLHPVLNAVLARLPRVPSDARLEQGLLAWFSALRSINEALVSGRCARALLIAVDSLLDEDSLNWLSTRECLKTSDRPTGVMPGEAAVALLLEPENTKGKAKLEAIGLSPAADAAAPLDARALSAHAARVIADVAKDHTIQRWTTNLGGEEISAYALGLAQVSLRGLGITLKAPACPAASVGEVGVASAGIGVVMAIHGWARRYAAGERAGVIALAENGAGALRLAPSE